MKVICTGAGAGAAKAAGPAMPMSETAAVTALNHRSVFRYIGTDAFRVGGVVIPDNADGVASVALIVRLRQKPPIQDRPSGAR
ncbi:hypothetical protein KRMM14A1259_41960 [Krasilnikovia sp. MM14-A1259]